MQEEVEGYDARGGDNTQPHSMADFMSAALAPHEAAALARQQRRSCEPQETQPFSPAVMAAVDGMQLGAGAVLELGPGEVGLAAALSEDAGTAAVAVRSGRILVGASSNHLCWTHMLTAACAPLNSISSACHHPWDALPSGLLTLWPTSLSAPRGRSWRQAPPARRGCLPLCSCEAQSAVAMPVQHALVYASGQTHLLVQTRATCCWWPR